jgi:hypothetical protein
MLPLRAVKRIILSEASKIPGGYEAQEKAPDTLDKICQSYSETGRIFVWDGASDKTIWGDVRINHAFRAWHDYNHAITYQDFTLAGEKIVCHAQINRCWAISESNQAPLFKRILEVDCISQVEYFYKNGSFPDNQIDFFHKTMAA